MAFSSVVQPDDFSFSLSIPLKPLPVITIPAWGQESSSEMFYPANRSSANKCCAELH